MSLGGYRTRLNERVHCVDGFSMSVQANENAYCMPQENGCKHYTHVEVSFPSQSEPILADYVEGMWNIIYAYVPVDLVRHIIDKHGGIFSGEVPKGVPVYGITHYRKV